MLCPDINNFKPPKTICTVQKNVSLEKTLERVNLNNFYRSVIITCPDELNIPSAIQDSLLEDSDYYKVMDCSVDNLIDSVFINSFVKKGKLFCLSVHKNCINFNGVAITPDGILTLNVSKSVYQTLGTEGIKRPNDFYEIKVDLQNLKQIPKLKRALSQLENFDFYVSWEPQDDSVCPSTIAKYFSDNNYTVTQHALESRQLLPRVDEVPSLDIDIDEVVEWMGMIAHEANLSPESNYISTYYMPECSSPLQTTRVAVLLIKGFVTRNIIANACEHIRQYVMLRELNKYWAALSIQTVEESLYRWHPSSPTMFQSHNSSCNIFFTQCEQIIYSVSQLKYS